MLVKEILYNERGSLLCANFCLCEGVLVMYGNGLLCVCIQYTFFVIITNNQIVTNSTVYILMTMEKLHTIVWKSLDSFLNGE